MRLGQVFSVFCALLMGSTFAATAATDGDRKVALVIGNGAYKNAPDLPNPPNDARAMGTLLRSMGFQVLEGIDLDKQSMSGLVDEFTEAAYEADIGLVFYAGHGMQVAGKNYLIPVDAKLSSPAHLRTRTIEVGEIVASLPPDPNIGVVILDACRDNPLARSLARSLPATRSASVGTGLAAVQMSADGDGTGGTLIAYATDPGAVALDGQNTTNSPYTQALVRHLSTPGIELQSALTRVRGEVAQSTEGRQRPWHNASLGREVFLGGALAPAPVAAAPAQSTDGGVVVAALPSASDTVTRTNDASWEVERRFWDEAAKRNTVAHYEAYLAQYPNGKFAQIAALNIQQLKATDIRKTEAAKMDPANSAHAATATTRQSIEITEEVRNTPGTVVTEEAIGMNRNDKRDLQKRLNALGHNAGGADGRLGPKSRTAIGGWQKSNGIIETQMLTPNQWAVLKAQSEPYMAEIRRQEAAAAAARKTTTRSTRSNTAKSRQSSNRQASRKRKRGGKTGAFIGGVAVGAGAAIITCKAIRGC